MIMGFYKYAMNQYLEDIFNNFLCEESIWMIFIYVSIPIKMKFYIFCFIENTSK